MGYLRVCAEFPAGMIVTIIWSVGLWWFAPHSILPHLLTMVLSMVLIALIAGVHVWLDRKMRWGVYDEPRTFFEQYVPMLVMSIFLFLFSVPIYALLRFTFEPSETVHLIRWPVLITLVLTIYVQSKGWHLSLFEWEKNATEREKLEKQVEELKKQLATQT